MITNIGLIASLALYAGILVLLNSVSTDFVLSPTKYGFRKQDAILVLPDPSVGRRADIDASEPAQAGEGLRNPRRKQIKGQAC